MFSGKYKIILVEDDKLSLAVLKSIVRDLGAEVINFTSAASALEYIKQNDDVNVLITDINMPEMPGDVLIREALSLKPWIDVLVVTGSYNINNAIPTFMSGAREIFIKPISKEKLLPFIQASLDRNKRWAKFLQKNKP